MSNDHPVTQERFDAFPEMGQKNIRMARSSRPTRNTIAGPRQNHSRQYVSASDCDWRCFQENELIPGLYCKSINIMHFIISVAQKVIDKVLNGNLKYALQLTVHLLVEVFG